MNYENKIIDAIEAIVTNAVQKANYDKTIQGIIMRCMDKETGKYLVKYQDASIEAYSNDTSQTYSSGVAVYVLVPGNDMSQVKTIVGTVDKLGDNYIEISNNIDNFQSIGNSIITNENTFGVCSYKNPDGIILYDVDSEETPLIDVDTFAADLYLKKADYIILSADFKTTIDKIQRYKGDYGLAIELEFNSSNGETFEKTYLLNTNNMTGNPYEYFNSTNQKTVYEIDGEKFSKIKKITFYSHNFAYEAQDKENDIFIKNIELIAATKNIDEDNSGNYLILHTNKGIYFDDNDSEESDRIAYAQVKINNKTIKDGAKELKYFWFKLNRKITSANLKYNRYGGNGWECLNNYSIIGDNVIEWDTTNYNFKTLKSDNLAKENNYKCVVVYNNEIVLSKEFSIFNYSSLYDTSIVSDSGFNFYNGNGNPTLTCLIKDLDVNEYDFYWSYIDSNGQFNNIAETISNKNTLKINVSEIFNYNIYICSAYKNDILVGEAKATITNEISDEITYNIVIGNGKQIFKYDEEGLSPMSKKFDNPQEIYPLSFKLYDSKGVEVNLDTLEASSYSWIVPNQDSMIEILDSEGEPSEIDTENHNDIYTGKKNLFFRIASIYDYKKTRNSIEIRVNYNNKIISATTDFIFLKEGENGSNGTDYICRIILNNKNTNSKLNYPIVYHNNISGEIKLNYDRPIGEENTWFKVMLYKESERAEIFKGSSTGMSTENKPVNIKWEILKNKYSITKSDISNFNINALTGELNYQNYGENIPANIIKCTVKYNDINYIATLPITLIEMDGDYKIDLVENTGFRAVFYSSDGRQPKYDNSNPFTLDVEDDNDNFSYNWSSVGRIYLNEWTNTSLLTKIEENKNTARFQPSETYDGYCVNNSVICNISNGGNQIAKVYIPIYLYLNKYGNAALNDWDGNSIQVNDDGGYILSPQIGAGYKDQDNAFTGIFMGSVAQEKEVKTGLFGYSKGVQTILLDAEKGSATFGKSGSGQIIIEPSEDKAVLRSGNYETIFSQASGKYLGGRVYFKKVGDNYIRLKEGTDYTIGSSIVENNIYVWSDGEGLEIDLVDPHIYFGSGKFRLEKDGSIYADGYATIADLENGEYEIPSSSVENLDNFIAKTADDIEDLQNQIDGNVTTWFYDYVPKPRYDYPTESANKPASDWKNDKEKQNHVGDLFYDSTTGYCYRYMTKEVNGTTYYVWLQLSDSDIAAALAAAEKAQDTADNKRRVFYSQPTPPYDLGDLWAQGPNGELLKCIKAKTENQTFSLTDWDLASKYTDDTAVDNLKKEVISEIIVQYALSNSTTQQPSESAWSDVAPVWEDGKYMWQRTITIYADSTPEVPHQDISNPTCIAGAAGQNAYTVILTNENQSIAAGVSAAIPTTISTDVIGYKGVNQVNTSVGTISGLPAGITATIKNNNKKNTSIEFTITSELTTEMGTITIPIIIDGITFNKKFSYTLSKTGVGVRAIIEYYAINNDKDNAPADNQFSIDFVAPTAQNKYLWNYEKITYTDNSVVSTSKRIIGNYSEDGEHGTSITGVVNKYQVSDSNTTVPSTWQDTPPQLTATNKYLWNYEIISYSSGNPTETTPCIIGVYGDKGDSITITSKSVSYQLGNSGTATPTGEWKNNVPTLTQGKYLWTRTYVKYSDNTENTSYSVSYIAIDGNAGRGISSTEVKYKASNSGTEIPTGTWDDNPPSLDEGQYLWTRTTINYTDGLNPTVSYSVSYKGVNGTSVNISSKAIEYAEGDNGTTAPSTGWSTNIPSVPDEKYLWTRTTVNYSDGNSTVSYSVSYQSKDGQDATQYYTHVMYATSSSGANISSNPAGKSYIGIRVDTKESASTKPGDYTWSKFIGDDATQYYTYIRYSQYSDGHNYVVTPTENTKYVGLCITTSTTPPVYNDSSWKWSKYVGDDAIQYYTHIMYADDASGTNISSNPSGKTYIGIRIDEIEAASTNPSDYTWSKFIGDNGTDGFSLWTTSVTPTNNIYTRNQITGPSSTQNPRVGEIIIRSNRYQYTITAVSGNNITVGSAVDLKGADGTNGTSITWKGNLSSPPANPQLLWAYYNTVDKKSYIYNGSSWDQMTTDGTNATQYYYHVVYCNNTSTGEGYSTSPSNQLYTGTYVDTASADASSWSGLSGKNVKWNYTKGDDGVDSTNIVCGNEAQAIVCNSDGKVSAETTITIPFAGYIGSEKAACSVTYSTLPSGMSLVSNTAGTATQDGSLILKVAKNATLGNINNGVITLTFSCNSKTFIKTFSWSKALAGVDGINGRSVTSITEQYYLSTSKTELIGGEWVEDYSLIEWELNKYVWTRSKIIYKNSDDTTSTEYTTAQCSSEWEAVNNIQVGGRNLLLNTSNEEWSFNANWSDNYKFSDYAKEYVKANDTLTLSFEAKGSVEMYFDFYYRSDTTSYNQDKYFFPGFHATTEYQKFVFTGLSGIDLTDIKILRIRQNSSMHGSATTQGNLYIKNLKLEKGNKATDWTAAPEDAIETIDVEYYLSTSKTTTSGGSWQTVAPEWVDGKYMWSRQKVIYGSGAYITRNETCIAGATGETGSGMKFFGTRNWTDAQITGTYVIGYSTTWTNNLGIDVKVGDLLLLEVTNTTYNTKFQYILETTAVAANGKPTATIVAITQDGHDGTDAKVVNISASSQIFKSTTGASGTFTPQYIYLYPDFQNVTYSKWQYSTNGTTWTDVTSGSDGLTIGTYNSIPNSLRIIRTSELYTDSVTSVSFKCLSNESNAYDTISIVKIYDVTELEVGGRNYIYYGKGDNKLGFFKNFATINTEEGYGEQTLVSQKTYRSISIKPGYLIDIRDYPEGKNIRFSFDIMFTEWNFPEGASAGEWWIGQRYTAVGGYKSITTFNMPKPGVTAGCELNQWYHFSATKKIPAQPADTSGTDSASIQLYNPSADVEARTTFRIKNVKLEFGNMETNWSPSVEEIQDQFNTNATNLANAVLEINNDIKDLQDQIDGNITTWFYNYVPTLQNEPASLWTTDDMKNNHLGDLFYNTDTGYCYRFMISGSTYSWSRLKDDEISEALALAQTAKDTADNKRRVFYSTPTPPYDQGDLWVQGANGDILRCQTPKATGTAYSIDDWVLASKYTDDGLAQQANDKIDNLELGGRNLILNTSSDWKELSVDNFYGRIISSNDFFGLEVGDEYTLRFKVRTETGKILKARIQFFTDSSHRISVYGEEEIQNGEGYVSYSGKLTEAQRAYATMQICVDANNSPEEAKTGTTTEYYAELKLEKGNRYTDWTPAPEDLKANQQLWYTTTSTVTPPASSAIWSKTTPTSSDYYIWQKIITTYSNGVTEESDVACIYSPTITISSIVTQYYIHNSKVVAPSNTAAGWSDEKPEWKSSYYGSRFLWIRTKYNYTGGKASEYSTPYYDPTWEAIGELEKSIQDSATLVNDSINNGTVQIHDGYIDIKNGEDQGIRFSSGGISFKINNEYTSVWDITGKFNAEKILVENLTASSILSGTLTLKAATDDTNGVFILQNADGAEVARIDVNGLKVTAVDGSYVWLRTGEDDPTKKGLYLCDAQGNTYFQNDTTEGIVEIGKERITEYQEYAGKVRIIPISSGSTVRGIGFIGV